MLWQRALPKLNLDLDLPALSARDNDGYCTSLPSLCIMYGICK